jgi:hypothetical protein
MSRIRPQRVVPENLLRWMDAKDRAELGPSGLLAVERELKQIIKAEKEEHKTVISWSYLQKIRCLHDPYPWRKSRVLPAGWPDFTFIYSVHSFLVEMKVFGNKLDPDQVKIHAELAACGTPVVITSSADETIKAVRGWALPLGWAPA